VLAPAAAQALDVAATAPTQTVRVGKQRIGYRSFGSGRPVVFIQGLAGTIDGWPPSFLDSVAAAHHRVVIFDNEGVGRSTLRKGTLSIRRMAQDTARLIGALRLKRPDVVGWSMGGMTAQSFAVNYPRRLRRLVLMATAPGDGKATLPDAAALQELASGDAAKLLARLFPPDQTAARDRYVSDILRRLDFNGIAPPAVVTAQLGASAKWITGGDPDGARVARVKALTLVGGGELDELLPVANQRHLAALIPHAKLITYPDAAHGFFFQHDADFVPRLVGFLR
jgi:pimeloyl-ACP methyl ester carboxylesterase